MMQQILSVFNRVQPEERILYKRVIYLLGIYEHIINLRKYKIINLFRINQSDAINQNAFKLLFCSVETCMDSNIRA